MESSKSNLDIFISAASVTIKPCNSPSATSEPAVNVSVPGPPSIPEDNEASQPDTPEGGDNLFDTKEEEKEKSQDDLKFEAPDWYWQHCFQSADQLKNKPPGLIVRDDGESGTKTTDQTGLYQIDSVVFKELQAIKAVGIADDNQETRFRYDAVYLRYPPRQDEAKKKSSDPVSRHARPPPGIPFYDDLYGPLPLPEVVKPPVMPKGTNTFMLNLVEHFAKACKADLIVLTLDDLRDLAAHFGSSKTASTGPDKLLRSSLSKAMADRAESSGLDADPYDPYHTSYAYARSKDDSVPAFPFSALMRIPGSTEAATPDSTKAAVANSPEVATTSSHPEVAVTESQEPDTSDSSEAATPADGDQQPPLIIHIPEVQHLLDTLGRDILAVIQKQVKKLRGNGRDVVTIFSTPDLVRSTNHPEKTVMADAGTHPMKVPIFVAPSKLGSQVSLFIKDHETEKSHKHSNIRSLQYMLRATLEENAEAPLLQPYASWDFLDSGEISDDLSKEEFSDNDLEQLVHVIGPRHDAEGILRGLTALKQHQDQINPWWSSVDQEYGKQDQITSRGPWSDFPPHVQKAVQLIEQDPVLYAAEYAALSYLVDPKDINDGWKDIAVEPRIKDSMIQLVTQLFTNKESAYGILKRAKIAGALLYGPPGTGKTHLARVVAHECGAAMISVTSADIDHKHVGETEKGIKALFSLGRLMYPSIIFIDEADAMLQSRDVDSHEYSTSRKNQLLTEMDGLIQSDNAPFALLATNFPRHLDHAVLRRVPSLLHLGLPSKDLRQKIFEIYLRDESLNMDVDTAKLAAQTQGYSGADIKTVCVQAALSCDTFFDLDGCRRRLLSQKDFMDAQVRCRPTASRLAMEEIRAFRTEHDPLAADDGDEGEAVPLAEEDWM